MTKRRVDLFIRLDGSVRASDGSVWPTLAMARSVFGNRIRQTRRAQPKDMRRYGIASQIQGFTRIGGSGSRRDTITNYKWTKHA